MCVLQYSEFSKGCLLHLFPVFVIPQQIYLKVPFATGFLLALHAALARQQQDVVVVEDFHHKPRNKSRNVSDATNENGMGTSVINQACVSAITLSIRRRAIGTIGSSSSSTQNTISRSA